MPAPPPPPPQPPYIVPEREIVDDLCVLWSFERNFAHRYKRLSSSIEEMRCGFERGADGYVLKRPIWEARWEADDRGAPASYKVDSPEQGNKKKVGAYRFRVIPVTDNAGNDIPLARVLSAFPQTPAEDDVCFVALCGPVDLKNDFSWSKAWPVYELKATEDVVGIIRALESISLDQFQSRLADGDLASFVKTKFDGLEWPDQPSGDTAQ